MTKIYLIGEENVVHVLRKLLLKSFFESIYKVRHTNKKTTLNCIQALMSVVLNSYHVLSNRYLFSFSVANL